MNRWNLSSVLVVTLACLSSAGGAATFPYSQGFSGATVGLTKSPYNGAATNGTNESTLGENPTGWIDGPPVTSGSNTSPWSIADGGGTGGKYLRFSGPANFDGNGRGYATVPVTGVPTSANSGFTTSSNFKFDALTLDGTTDTFRFGIGVLGQFANFASSSAATGSAGGASFYFADVGFTSAGTTDLASQQLNLRIFRFGGASNVELVSSGLSIPVGYLNTSDLFTLAVSGVYDAAGGLTLSATFDDATTVANDGYSVTAPVEATPLAGTYFGYRHSSAAPGNANRLGTLDFRQDNFAVTLVPEPTTLGAIVAAGLVAFRRRRA